MDLNSHVFDNAEDSGYISTSKTIRGAEAGAQNGPSYLYVLKAAGVDVNETLGLNSPYPWENEVAVPLIVLANDIFGVYPPGGGFALNPSFVP